MHRLEPEPEHTSHVAFLALRLFDQLTALHGLGGDERVILEGAACLHDIGWPASKGGTGHHKHSARIIRKQAWKHLRKDEVELLALVARYHRRAEPCPEHVDFHSLTAERQNTVRRLAAILRVADALDRSHLQYVLDVKVRVDGKCLELTLISKETPRREMVGVEKKGTLARAVFGREITFKVQAPS